MYDVVIVGAGIIGSFLAYDLSRFDLKVLVVDKENDVGNVTKSSLHELPYNLVFPNNLA